MIVPSNFLDIFFNLKMKGISPILAHPERYRFVQKNVDNLDKLKNLEVITLLLLLFHPLLNSL